MVSFTDEAFRKKAEKLIERLHAEDGFFLLHLDDSHGNGTLFGNGHIVFILPLTVGQAEREDTGKGVMKLITDRLWSDDAKRNMRWVPLPKASELKPGRDKEHPVRCHLAATDMLSTDITQLAAGECAAYPFDVQARYLKMALQLAVFMGHKDTRSVYSPLCLWAHDDHGNEALGIIMPMRE